MKSRKFTASSIPLKQPKRIDNSEIKFNIQYRKQSLKNLYPMKELIPIQQSLQCDISLAKIFSQNQQSKVSNFSGVIPYQQKLNSKRKLFDSRDTTKSVHKQPYMLQEVLTHSIFNSSKNIRNDSFPKMTSKSKINIPFDSNITIQNSVIATHKSYFRPLKEVRVAKFDEKFQEYQEHKDFIQNGILTTRNLSKYLRPKREKFEIHLQKEIKNIEKLNMQVTKSSKTVLAKMDEKLKLANFLLNIKQNVFDKNETVEKLIDKFQQQVVSQPQESQSYNNMMFLSDMQLIFLKKKKMKQQLIQHEEKMASFIKYKEYE